MIVGSPLEMYVTHFAWGMFSVISGLFAGLYIYFVPLIALFAMNWFSGVKNTESRPGVQSALRRQELMLLQFVVVFILFVVPFVPLSLTDVKYQTSSTPYHDTSTEGIKDVGSDNSVLNTTGAPAIQSIQTSVGTTRVPIGWYGVMAVSSGITYAVTQAIPRTLDIRMARMVLDEIRFANQKLASEINRFQVECFRPANQKYLEMSSTGAFAQIAPASVQQVLVDRPDDVKNIGSRVFLDTPGLYAQCPDGMIDLCRDSNQAKYPVDGWLYDLNRDGPVRTGMANDFGRPMCRDWWLNPQRGLRERVLDTGELGKVDSLRVILAKVRSYVGNPAAQEEKVKDLAVQRTIENTLQTTETRDDVSGGSNDAIRASERGIVTGSIGFVGTMWEAGKTAVKVENLKTGLLMIQGALLFIVYLLLPFVVLFTGLTLAGIVKGALTIFALKFLTALWALAHFMDSHMVKALYPDTGAMDWMSRSAYNMQSEMLFGIVAALMYVLFPLLFMTILGWAGVQLGRSVNAAVDGGNSTAGQISNSGVGVAKQAAGASWSAATKVGKGK